MSARDIRSMFNQNGTSAKKCRLDKDREKSAVQFQSVETQESSLSSEQEGDLVGDRDDGSRLGEDDDNDINASQFAVKSRLMLT